MTKIHKLLTIAAIQLAAVQASAVSELDIGLSADMIGINYSALNEQRGSLWGLGAIHNDDASASAVSATFNVVGETLATSNLQTGLGLKGVVHDTFQTAASLALGGFARYEPPGLGGFGIEGQAYLAPEMLNSNDADQYRELMLRLTYAINPRARIFGGWLDQTVKYDHLLIDEVEINRSLNLGFVLNF